MDDKYSILARIVLSTIFNSDYISALMGLGLFSKIYYLRYVLNLERQLSVEGISSKLIEFYALRQIIVYITLMR